MRNVALLRAGGVRFANGTDAGMPGTHHGAAALHEMELLVSGGLTPLEAITAATGNSARALGVAAERGTIAEGKLADLVLVQGAPYEQIADIRNVQRVWLGGREIDRTAKAAPIASTHAHRTLDDFERPDGRSAAGSLWLNHSEGGHDRTRIVYTRVLRDEGNHALFVTARMAEKDRPFARMSLPLHPGAVEPVDASAFRGVRFDVRGEGAYKLLIPSASRKTHEAAFTGSGRWQTVRIPFASDWDITGLLMLQFDMTRAAGEPVWLELDNVRFF
jgi:hypothetical protein